MTAAEQVITPDHAGHDEGRGHWSIALTDQVLVRIELADGMSQGGDLSDIIFVKLRMLSQIADEHFMRKLHVPHSWTAYQMIRWLRW